MLDAEGALGFLVARGLLDRSEILDGGVVIVEASRRNRNLQVRRRGGPSYLLKQGIGAQRRITIGHEAAMYRYLASLGHEELARLVPAVVAYAPQQRVLVLELAEGVESLEARNARRRGFSMRDARGLAAALATLHRATAVAPRHPMLGRGARHGLAWGLALSRPVAGMITEMSNGSMLAVRMIQRFDGVHELLVALADDWRTECLVHGDVRFDNWLLPRGAGPGGQSRVKLVDWELAGWGDPCWDVGGVLANYITAWLLACPISGETPPDDVLDLGQYRFSEMQRAAGAFWAAYAETMAPSTNFLRLSMRFAAVHMLQSMIEDLQPSALLTGRAVCLAQLALNVLERPEDAGDHFLALPAA